MVSKSSRNSFKNNTHPGLLCILESSSRISFRKIIDPLKPDPHIIFHSLLELFLLQPKEIYHPGALLRETRKYPFLIKPRYTLTSINHEYAYCVSYSRIIFFFSSSRAPNNFYTPVKSAGGLLTVLDTPEAS